MIDLEMLEFSLGSVESAGHDMAEIKCASLRKLMDALKQAEKDAARYRFLRDNCTTQQADSHGPIFVMTIRQKDNPFNVGLSIDEAMNGSRTDE